MSLGVPRHILVIHGPKHLTHPMEEHERQSQRELGLERKNNPAVPTIIAAVIAAVLAGGVTYAIQNKRSTDSQSTLQAQVDSLKTQIATLSTPTPSTSPVATACSHTFDFKQGDYTDTADYYKAADNATGIHFSLANGSASVTTPLDSTATPYYSYISTTDGTLSDNTCATAVVIYRGYGANLSLPIVFLTQENQGHGNSQLADVALDDHATVDSVSLEKGKVVVKAKVTGADGDYHHPSKAKTFTFTYQNGKLVP